MNGSSPSTTSKFDPPPRNLCAIPSSSSSLINSGIDSCRPIRNRSVVPPIPNEVNSDNGTPASRSTSRPGSALRTRSFSMRIRHPVIDPQLGPQQHDQLVARTAYVACADGHNRVAWTRLVQQKLNRILHRPVVVNVFVPGIANGIRQRFAGHARNRAFTRGINIEQHQHVRLIERGHKLVPQMLRPRVAVRLKEHQQTIELAPARSLERSFDLGGMMAVIVHDRNSMFFALNIETTAYASELR